MSPPTLLQLKPHIREAFFYAYLAIFDPMYSKPIALLIFSLISFHLCSAQSMRGISVLNDSQVWVSGNKGYIGRLNADTLEACPVPVEYRNKDFRDIHAFSSSHAIAMSVADSGVLLKTRDFGRTWLEVFRDNVSNVFFDVIEFSNGGNLGLLMGDPLPTKPNYLYFRVSLDSGDHWIELSDGKWNRISPKLDALFAASGSSVRILDFDYKDTKGIIALKVLIGGGGSKGASVRMAYVNWNTYGELLNEKITDIPLPLPSEKGWGVYGLSEAINNQIVVAGGHWQYPNGRNTVSDSGENKQSICDDGLYLLKFSDAAMSLKPLKLCNYISGTAFLNANEIVSVGSSGISKLNLPRKRSDGKASLSWNPNQLGITEYVTNSINALSTPFKGLNSVSVSENYVWMTGSAPKHLLLRIPKTVYTSN